MIKTFNQIIKTQSFDRVGSIRAIQRKTFSNEMIHDHYLGSLMFAHLIFLNCNFIDLDFRHANFASCEFSNCSFRETLFLKSELDNCTFTNCNIFQSDLGKANFIENNFTDCQFKNVVVTGAVFTECNFIRPKFTDIPFLQSVTFDKSKIWTSTKCIEVDVLDDVSQVIKDLEN